MATPALETTGSGARLDISRRRQTRYWRTLRWLLRYFRPYRGRVAVAFVALLAYIGTIGALPLTVRVAIDRLLTPAGIDMLGSAAFLLLFGLVALAGFATRPHP